MKWVEFDNQKPEPGQLVAVNFKENWTRLVLCYFDNRASWESREDDTLGDECSDREWFTDFEDKGDWWEAQYIACWATIAPPLAKP